MNRVCANCGRTTPDQEQMYTIRIEMFARAEPLVFDLQDLSGDSAGKLEELVSKMEQMDVEEAADQVHEEYSFDLCGACRGNLHRGLKARSKATGA